MESEIKAAWKRGFIVAMTAYSSGLSEDFIDKQADRNWDYLVKKCEEKNVQLTFGDWNARRIRHRDEG